MIKSMTGFGRGEHSDFGKTATVEIRSVNHRYFDFSFRAFRTFQFMEEKAKTKLKEEIVRGKVDVYLNIDQQQDESADILIDWKLAEEYIAAYKEMAEKFEITNDLTTTTLAARPDVIKVEKKEADAEELWTLVEGALQNALKDFIKSRENEGQRLKEDFLFRIDLIEKIVGEIEVDSPKIVTAYRARIEERIRELLEAVPYDEARLLTEVAIFSDRVNVTEEIVRLKSHFKELRSILEAEEAVGRKLDFLIQELNREINTIGSKSNDFAIAKNVVSAKAEIEKMREQIQNIE